LNSGELIKKEQIIALFDQINVWTRGDERAPHKPLLLLLALGRCSRGEGRRIPYSEVDKVPLSNIEDMTFST
jgi:putative restriction endonuclease